MPTFTVPEQLNGQRIDLALVELMKPYSRTLVQKLIRKGLISVSGKVAKKGSRVFTDEKVEVKQLKLASSKFKSKDIPLEILYEDEDLLIVNKPPGLLTHPSAHEREQTLVNALLHHCGDRLSGIGGELRPGIVHRLDKDTSGILMVAKHDECHKDLSKQIQERKVEKYYLALANGVMDSQEGTIEAPLKKTQVQGKNKVVIGGGDESRDSTTLFKVLDVFSDRWSLLEVHIITGRMHQIRVHLAGIKHPVAGDEVYGSRRANTELRKLGLKRQFLHAHRLKFKHPRTKKWVEFEAPLAKDLQAVLDKLTQLEAL
ncbi:MAG: RluA family pseudouridine synthase [bacterium]|nr:RluA family pseudouridine synthase [bacterium]